MISPKTIFFETYLLLNGKYEKVYYYLQPKKDSDLGCTIRLIIQKYQSTKLYLVNKLDIEKSGLEGLKT